MTTVILTNLITYGPSPHGQSYLASLFMRPLLSSHVCPYLNTRTPLRQIRRCLFSSSTDIFVNISTHLITHKILIRHSQYTYKTLTNTPPRFHTNNTISSLQPLTPPINNLLLETLTHQVSPCFIPSARSHPPTSPSSSQDLRSLQ